MYINDIKSLIEDEDIPDSIQADLRQSLSGCSAALKDLNSIIDENTELAFDNGKSSKRRHIWKRMRWDQAGAESVKSRLVLSIQLLETIRKKLDR